MVLSMFAAVTAYAGRPAEPATFRADHFDVAEMIREADQTGDGKLNFEEFKKVSLGWAGCGGLLGGGGTRCRGGGAGRAGALAVAPRAPPPWRACGLRPPRDCDSRILIDLPLMPRLQAIVTARKVYQPDLVDDHECACKVGPAPATPAHTDSGPVGRAPSPPSPPSAPLFHTHTHN